MLKCCEVDTKYLKRKGKQKETFGSVTVSAKSSGLLSRPAFTFWRVKGFFNLDGMSIDFKILMKQNPKIKTCYAGVLCR